MPFRIFPIFFLLVTVLFSCLSGLCRLQVAKCDQPTPRKAADNAAPPNVVFLISDDQAWTDYGFMGHPAIHTPHIDRLASQSAVFRNAYVPTALCRPSLATIISGKYPHQHRITGNDPAPELADTKSAEYKALQSRLIGFIDQQPLLPKLLATKGYRSFQSGKWWEGNYARGGFTHGMTRGFPEPGGRHGDDGLTIGRQGLGPIFEFIDSSASANEPFFLWYAPLLPHSPHNPPERLLEKYKANSPSIHYARYYAMCEWFDESIGQLLAHLDAKGLSENTIFVYTGDNGWLQSDKSPNYALRSKQSPYDGGVRQPLLIRWDGVIKPRDYSELASTIDIVPTVFSATNCQPPSELPGLDLLPLIRDQQPLKRDAICGEGFAHDVYDLNDPNKSLLYRWVRREKWKLILTSNLKLGRYAESHPRSELRPQLFDLEKDPFEEVNIASKHPDVVADLVKMMDELWDLPTEGMILEWKDE
ncbi:MAG: sulfatase [Pirellula sp.]|jgi:arylsulfatase A-like enzyme